MGLGFVRLNPHVGSTEDAILFRKDMCTASWENDVGKLPQRADHSNSSGSVYIVTSVFLCCAHPMQVQLLECASGSSGPAPLMSTKE